MSHITVQDIMSDSFFAAHADESIQQVTENMAVRNIGAIGIVKEGELAGMFSERDLVTKVVSRGVDPAKTAVEQVMTSPVITISPMASANDALETMMSKRIRHLPVVTEQGQLVGMLGIRDLLVYALGQVDGRRP